MTLIAIIIGVPLIMLYGLIIALLRWITYLFTKDTEHYKKLEKQANSSFGLTEEELAICYMKSKKTNFDPASELERSFKELEEDLKSGKVSEKVKALMELRSHAFCYDFVFVGLVESTKFPKIKLEDLEGNKLPSRYLVQKVDFGYSINKALSKVCGLPLKQRKGKVFESCLVLEDGIVYNIEEKLSKVLSNEVRIKFIDKSEKTDRIE